MSFKPHIKASAQLKEFTFRATFVGIIFGFFFAVANAYLALKIGTTISASIPAAILSMTLLKVLCRKPTILENNIVQTIATIGEGLAAGVVFTIPALMILGETPSVGKIFLLSSLGGILGILFMIPMRRFIIVEEHKQFPFPEGTACAEILKAGEKGSHTSLMAVWGLLIAVFYKLCTGAFFLWKEIPVWTFRFFQNAQLSIDATPALLGVGYIIGPRISSYMFAGGVTAWWILIPLIKFFGHSQLPIYPSSIPLDLMSSDQIWNFYIRYIGAGAIAVAGLASLLKIIPLLGKTAKAAYREILTFKKPAQLPRTDQDISMSWLILGSLAIILTLWLFPGLPMNFFTIVLLVILSFFFVAVTSITVGIVGSTSNPVSGMVITTLLLTCIIFVLLGWTERVYLISAITMGSVACSAICLAGTTSQDLKTGFLLGATPRSQQIAEIIGVLIPALSLGYTLYLLNAAYQIGSPAMPAPQAMLLSLIAEGVISGDLPYLLVGIGMVLSSVILIFRIPALTFALGLYLPLSLSAGIIIGGLLRAYVNRYATTEFAKEKGVLLSSGLVGGDACTGVVIAFLTIFKILPTEATAKWSEGVSLFAYFLLAALLAQLILRKKGRSSSLKS